MDYSSALLRNPQSEEIKNLLIAESIKVKLYFDDETLKAINDFIKSENKEMYYNPIVEALRKSIH